jgi:arginine utilization protein RocB
MEQSKYFNRCFNLTKRLCKIPSVCGTRGEASIAEFLFQYIVTRPEIRNLGAMPEILEIPGENHKKAVLVFLPSRSALSHSEGESGEGRLSPVFATEHPTIVLLGHFDTVGIDEYGEFKSIASDSTRLKQLLSKEHVLPDDVRADLDSGKFEFGRGWLDMKSGVSAIVEVFLEYARSGGADGALFLALCPDEEGNSLGIRTLAPRINSILSQRKLKIRCVINSDYTSPLEPGDTARHIYTGTIGKYLMLFSVFGRECHASQVWEGINAAALAGWLASNLESDPQLVDQLAQEVTAPPATIYLKDNMEVYSVMTPSVAHFYLNQFTVKATPDQVLAKYLNRIRGFTRHWLERRIKRFERFVDAGGKGKLLNVPVPVIDLIGLIEQAKHVSQNENFTARYQEIREEFAAKETDERKASMRVIEWLVHAAKAAPCIVVSFCPPFYPGNYLLGDERDMVATAVERSFTASAPGEEYDIRRFYPYISDMSFFSFPDVPLRSSHWRFLIDNCPYPVDIDEWSLLGELNAPVVNVGPSGQGAHTIYERVERDWSFGTMPLVLERMVAELFKKP